MECASSIPEYPLLRSATQLPFRFFFLALEGKGHMRCVANKQCLLQGIAPVDNIFHIACWPGSMQYEIYCSGSSFDMPMQQDTDKSISRK